LVNITYINPRDFTTDKHQTVDSRIYGGGEGLLMKAKPIIDAVEHAISLIQNKKKPRKKLVTGNRKQETLSFQIIYPSPSTTYFNQQMAFDLTQEENIIFVCGRYEGIDYRFEHYCTEKYPENFRKVSIGKYILYGGEVPCMTIMEAITRLLPGGTHKPPLTESYYPEIGEDTVENPHYTRPQEIYGYKIPDILLSGHHKNIDKWRDDMMS
jgi:tRNA (guanine37-N1)-methyltransferase